MWIVGGMMWIARWWRTDRVHLPGHRRARTWNSKDYYSLYRLIAVIGDYYLIICSVTNNWLCEKDMYFWEFNFPIWTLNLWDFPFPKVRSFRMSYYSDIETRGSGPYPVHVSPNLRLPGIPPFIRNLWSRFLDVIEVSSFQILMISRPKVLSIHGNPTRKRISSKKSRIVSGFEILLLTSAQTLSFPG